MNELEQLQADYADLSRVDDARHHLCEALSNTRDKLSAENRQLRKEVQEQRARADREEATNNIVFQDWRDADAACVARLGGKPGELLLTVIDRVVGQISVLRSALVRIGEDYPCHCHPRHEGGCRAYAAQETIKEVKGILDLLRAPGMTAADHSVMVYLLDCIECAPHKAADLLSIAGKRGASEKFVAYVGQLTQLVGDEVDLVQCCHRIREELR